MGKNTKRKWIFGFATIIGTFALLGGIIWVECPTHAAPLPSEKPKVVPTGELNIGYENIMEGICDPMMNGITIVKQTRLLYDYLVGLTPDANELSRESGIASEWEQSTDGLSWTFKLRKGVKFHNGWGEVTAEDVKFSIERIISKESRYLRKFLFKQIISIEVLDPYTVVMTTKKPNSWLPFFLSPMTEVAGAILPKKYIEKKGNKYFARHPIGSGPYKFVEYEPAEHLKFEAVDHHWYLGVPKYKTLWLKEVPERGTRIAMFRTGALDIMSVPPEDVKKARGAIHSRKGFKLVGGIYPNYWMKENPTSDIRVRKALSYAIDREAIIKNLMGGYGETKSGWVFGPAGAGWDPALNQPDPYDPQKAKQLLKEAGYPDGFKIKILDWEAIGAPYQHMVTLAISSYWEAIGVKTEIVPIGFGTFKSKWRRTKGEKWSELEKTRECLFALWTIGDRPNYIGFYKNFHSKNIHRNMLDPELDPLLDKWKDAHYGEEFDRAQQAVQKYLTEKHYTLGIAMVDEIYVYNPKKVEEWEVGSITYDLNIRALISRK